MSTNSITRVWDNCKIIVTVYKHYDGYPEAYGLDLAKFLKGYKIVNGLPLNTENVKIANGMKCRATQIIAHFKTSSGDVYIDPNKNALDVDYVYDIWEVVGKLRLAVRKPDEEKQSIYKPEDFILTFYK